MKSVSYSFFLKEKNLILYTKVLWIQFFQTSRRKWFTFLWQPLFPLITLKENVYILVNSQLSAQHGNTGKNSPKSMWRSLCWVGTMTWFPEARKIAMRSRFIKLFSGQQSNRKACLSGQLSCCHMNVCVCSICSKLWSCAP